MLLCQLFRVLGWQNISAKMKIWHTSTTEIFKKIGISILILNFLVNLECFFT
jgi:hypothetical protein